MRTAVIIALIPLALLVFFGDCATFRYLEDARIGRAKSDLTTIEDAIRKLAADEKFTAEDWDRFDKPGMLARTAKYLEQGQNGLIDPWGGAYVFERRDEGQQIVLTVRSSHEVERGVLGIELVISRTDGKVVERRELWR